MNAIYLVPQAALDGAEIGIWHAAACPDGIHSLLVVQQWRGHEAQDTFEARPDVLLLLPWAATTPPELVAAFAPPHRAAFPSLVDLALAPSDPVHETMRKLRSALSPALRW